MGPLAMKALAPLLLGGVVLSAGAYLAASDRLPFGGPERVADLEPSRDPVAGEAAPQRSPLGLNLAYTHYWATQQPFVDLFKQSGDWIPQREGDGRWDTGEALEVDEHGWITSLEPGQKATSLVAWDNGGRYAGGRYVLEFDGKGRLALFGDAEATTSKSGLGIDLKPRTGLRLELLETDPKDPVHDIRIVPAKLRTRAEKQPFDPRFIELIEPFRALRMMDLQQTNSPQVRWEDRARLDDARQTSPRGVALELLLDLANATERDPWLCVPHGADDAYVRAMAELTLERLDKQRSVYLEYSNEVWNNQFEQARYAREQGLELGLSRDGTEAQLRFYSRRSIEVFRIWREVFKSQRSRVVRVLAAQSANPWSSEVVLGWNDAHDDADLLAIAPYFGGGLGGPEARERVSGMTVDDVLDAAAEDLESVLAQVAQHAALAVRHDLRLVAYEAGQHLAGHLGVENDEVLTRLFQAANRHERMGDLYRRFFEGWKEAGGDEAFLFNSIEAYSKWGSWGLLEHQLQPREEAPKYRAALDFIDDQRAWW